jgi:hypothetical protein
MIDFQESVEDTVQNLMVPQEPDACIFPWKPISEVHASSPTVQVVTLNAFGIGPEGSFTISASGTLVIEMF